MIGKLSGVIDRVSGSQVLLDVNGVGYVVTCSARTLRNLGAVGTAASLLIETQVREDAINLYGFADVAEQDWFRLLITVQGVGAKVALAILGTIGPDELAAVIAAQDKAALTKTDGVGPKLGLRLVTELKDKVPSFLTNPERIVPAKGADLSGIDAASRLSGDAVSALVNLGYRRAEAFTAVASASRKLDQDPRLDELIRMSLGELSRGENAA
jgi:Holliday junction DNA helicase RuvA